MCYDKEYSLASLLYYQMDKQLTLDNYTVLNPNTSKVLPRNDGLISRIREGSDIRFCENCTIRGDIWFLKQHYCSRTLVKRNKK